MTTDTTPTKIDIEPYKAEYSAELEKLIEEYGTPSDVPYESQFLASEKLRAAYCVYVNPDLPRQHVFRQYAVDRRVWHFFVDDAEVQTAQKRMSRAEKVQSVIDWAAENVGKQLTLQTLMAECGIAYSMAKKISEDRPDVFRKVKRGNFEIRDPKADREADKGKSAK